MDPYICKLAYTVLMALARHRIPVHYNGQHMTVKGAGGLADL